MAISDKTRKMLWGRAKHIAWVDENLATSAASPKDPFFAKRLRTGRDVLHVIGGSQAHVFDNDNPNNEAEADTLGFFLGELEAYCDLWDGLTSNEKVRSQLDVDGFLRRVEELGFLVYGCQRRERTALPLPDHKITVCYICVLRNSSPIVARKEPELEELFASDSAASQFSNFVFFARR